MHGGWPPRRTGAARSAGRSSDTSTALSVPATAEAPDARYRGSFREYLPLLAPTDPVSRLLGRECTRLRR